MTYVIKDGDRYIESSEGFEFRGNGPTNNLTYVIYFNGARIGFCKLDSSTELYKAQGPEKQILGDFANFADICQALYPYVVYRRK